MATVRAVGGIVRKGYACVSRGGKTSGDSDGVSKDYVVVSAKPPHEKRWFLVKITISGVGKGTLCGGPIQADSTKKARFTTAEEVPTSEVVRMETKCDVRN